MIERQKKIYQKNNSQNKVDLAILVSDQNLIQKTSIETESILDLFCKDGYNNIPAPHHLLQFCHSSTKRRSLISLPLNLGKFVTCM